MSRKAEDLILKLKDLWTMYPEVDTVNAVWNPVMSFDANNDPCLTIGSGVPGTMTIIVRCKPVDYANKNSLGTNTPNYVPCVMQWITEANADSGDAAADDIINRACLLAFLAPIISLGTMLEWYESANGVAPTVAGMVAGNLVASNLLMGTMIGKVS